MPFAPHFLLQYGGPLGTAGEIWSNNIRLASQDGDADAPDDEAALTDAVLAIRGLFTRATSRIGSNVVCTYVKWNAIGPDGRYVSGTESNTRFLVGQTGANAVIIGAAGTAEGSQMPFSVTMCLTMITAFARGRGSKGRLFSPGPRLEVNGEGQIPAAAANAMATSYAQFLGELRSTPAGSVAPLQPVVASSINGALNPITGVQCGTVPDTMRSRRNSLVEGRVTQAVPAA